VSELFKLPTHLGLVIQQSLADRILHLFHTQSRPEGRGLLACPVSWKLLGRPSVVDMAEALVFVLRKGAMFRPESIHILGAMVPGIAPLPMGYSTKKFHAGKEGMKKIAQMLLGNWLPESLIQEVQAFDLQREDASHEAFATTECSICSHKIRERSKTRLYCGHIFSIDCITEYGERESSSLPSCPCCRRLICRDVCVLSSNAERMMSTCQLLGDRSAGLTDRLQLLSDEQVNQESEARGYQPRFKSIETLRRDIRIPNEINPYVELEMGSTNIVRTDDKLILAPKDGAALIPIELKSVPLLAVHFHSFIAQGSLT